MKRVWLRDALLHSTVIIAVGFSPLAAAFSTVMDPQAAEKHLARTREANRPLVNWLNTTMSNLRNWEAKRGTEQGPTDDLRYNLEPVPRLFTPNAMEAERDYNTKKLNEAYFPPNDKGSYIGVFFESAHPYIYTLRGPYQANSHKAARMDNPKMFEAAVSLIAAQGVKSMRIGPNLHEIDINNPETWNKFVDKLEIMWKHGATPTVSVMFFPSLKRWEVPLPNGDKGPDGRGVDYSKSYLLNPNMPGDMAKMTAALMQKIWERAAAFEKANGRKVNVVINPVNEPETLAGFNRHFWHGAYANWGHPELMRYYIPSIINIAMANVDIRLAAELASPGRSLLFMHNEAMTPDYYPSHLGWLRFAISKFMLGDLVTDYDFDRLLREPLYQMRARLESKPRGTIDEVEASLKLFVFGSWNKTIFEQEEARKELIGMFKQLQSKHRNYNDVMTRVKGKPMTVKHNNMLHLDYYYQTEFILNRSIPQLVAELSANNGEKLKYVLEAANDDIFLGMVKRAALKGEQRLGLPGRLWGNPRSRYDIDFADLLMREDAWLLSELIGLRNNYSLTSDAEAAQRRARAGAKLGETHGLLNDMVADDGKKLMAVLGVTTREELNSALHALARDKRDGGPEVQIRRDDTLRDILDKDERRVLHRIFGIKRERLLGFEPQHYDLQIRAGIRYGFGHFFTEYINTLRMTVIGVGESGGPWYVYAPLQQDQVLMETVMTGMQGAYLTQFGVGATDTRLWGKGPVMFHIRDDFEINPSGVVSTEAFINAEGKREHRVVLRTHNGQSWFQQWSRPFLGTIEKYFQENPAPVRQPSPLLQTSGAPTFRFYKPFQGRVNMAGSCERLLVGPGI